ncbi:MAG: hypothetical protein DHS20C18_22520 [Saprospiraceae bacterium]|nr:MAG: hypothetical protein DHS20C18_22520 [Saprospiraceae bacterium]
MKEFTNRLKAKSSLVYLLIGSMSGIAIMTLQASGLFMPPPPPPVEISCPPNQNIAIDQECDGRIPDFRASATLGDHCSFPDGVSITQIPLSGTLISGAGTVETVTLTADDGQGNTAQCSFEISTTDLSPPNISCPALLTIPLDVNCEATLDDFTALATISDNCTPLANISLSQQPESGTLLSAASPNQTLIVTAMDGSGNTANCTLIIVLKDEEMPIINCPENQTFDLDNKCRFSLPDLRSLATATDNCSDPVLITQMPSPGIRYSGDGTEVSITLTAFDEQGNSNNCTFLLSMEDNAAPVLDCPDDQILAVDNNCVIMVPDFADAITLTDNCSAIENSSITQSPVSGTFISGPGLVTPITISLTDEAGNHTDCSFNVTLVNQTTPTITCPSDQLLEADENCEALLPDYTSLAIANNQCMNVGNLILDQFPVAGSIVSGSATVTPITITVKDENDNVVDCTFEVTLVDHQDPQLSCPENEVIGLDANCHHILANYLDDIILSDNCSANLDITVTQIPAENTVLTGLDHVEVITIVATDQSGNIAQCDFTISLEDQIDPAINCPENQIISLDETCSFLVPDYQSEVVFSDQCNALDKLVFSQDVAAGTALTGHNTSQLINLQVEDQSGNNMNCDFTITLVDDSAPQILCPTNQTISLNDNCEAVVPDYTLLANVADYCVSNGALALSQSVASGSTISGNDASEVITLTVNDGHGNENNCSFTLTVFDCMPPAITCPANQILEVNANCEATLPDYRDQAIVSDNCTQVNEIVVSQNIEPATLLNGPMISLLTLSADDGNGNIESCSFQVQVSDLTPPEVNCPENQTLVTGPNCQASIPNYSDLVQATDNCASPAMIGYTQTPPEGTIMSGVGINTTLTIVVNDGHGNSISCNFELSLEDASAPNLTCPENQVILLDDDCEVALPDYRNEVMVTDNCAITGAIILTQTPPLGTLIGDDGSTQEISITADDGQGNLVNCSFNLTLEDEAAPEIICPTNQEVAVDLNCTFMVPDYSAFVSVLDNCADLGEIAITQTPVVGTVLNGDQTIQEITVGAADGQGNTAQCVFALTLIDETGPIISCPEGQELALGLNCEILLPDFTGAASITDNCSDNGNILIIQTPPAGLLLTDPGAMETISLEIFDEQGNISECSFSLLIADQSSPNIICPGDQVLNVTEDCQVPLPDYRIAAEITDNCTVASNLTLSQVPAPGTLVNLGDTPINITLSADDGHGNQQQCTFSLELTDAILPSITCPGNKVVAVNDNCNFGIPDYTDDAIVSQDCVVGSLSVVQSPPAGTIMNGHNVFQVITLTADNTSSCTFEIVLKDLQLPSISCPEDQLVDLDMNCEFSMPDYTALVTSSDNCTADNNLIISQNIAPGTLLSGATFSRLILLTVDDGNGNQRQCAFTLSLNDDSNPSISCPEDQLLHVDDQCTAQVPDFTHLATATDNCNTNINITQSIAVGTLLSGHNTSQLVTLTAEDDQGNQSQCDFNLSLSDANAPTIHCPSQQMLVVNNDCEGIVLDYRNLATLADHCSDNIALTQSPAVGNTLNGLSSAETITLTADDGNGNTASCTFNLILRDVKAPQITCPIDQEINLAANCEVEVPDFRAQVVVNDNCSALEDITLSQMVLPGTILGGTISTQVITMTATDDNNNTAQCTFNLSIKDQNPPSITCPVDHLLTVDDQCEIFLPNYAFSAPVADNCTATASILKTQSPAAGTLISGDGTSVTITLRATDLHGNMGSCTFLVSLEDNTAPTLICPEGQVINVDGNCPVQIPDYGSTAALYDNCTSNANLLTSLTQAPPVGTTVSGVGTTTIITLSVDDDNGNNQACEFTLRLEEANHPSITCPGAQLVQVDEDCAFSIPDYTQEAIAFSHCSSDQITITQLPMASTEISGHATTQVITLTATDQNGGSESCSFLLNLEDDTAPTIICPPDNEVIIDEQCEYLVPDFTSLAIVADNCSPTNGIEISQNISVFTILSGSQTTQEVVLTADDGNGNMNQCVFSILLLDMDDPTISCPPNQTLFLDNDCQRILPDFRNQANLDDNCAPANNMVVTQTPDAGTILNGHSSITTVTLSVMDENENSADCIFGVQLIDAIGPTISCPANQILVLDEACEALIPDYTTLVLTNDNCTPENELQVNQSPVAGTVLNSPGNLQEVILSTMDAAGNTASCSLIITLEDHTPPTIMCPQDVSLTLDDNCEISLPSYTDAATITDNCAPESELTLTQTPQAGTILAGHGVHQEVLLRLSDGHGQQSSCSLRVSLIDETSPFIVCPANQVLTVDENCEALLPGYSQEAQVTDNCSLPQEISVSQDIPAGTLLSGHNSSAFVTLTADDGHGNSNFCSFTVTLEDQTVPEITCPTAQDLNLNNFCQVELPDFKDLVLVSDYCGADPILTQMPDPGSIITVDSTITITVDDGNGNTNQCTFLVRLHDMTPPFISGCYANLVISNVPGMCHGLVPDLISFIDAIDNCGVATIVQDSLPGTIFGNEDGDTQEVNVTVTDINGNTRVCHTRLFLEDSEAPEAVCNNFTVNLNANGQADIVTANINGGSTDNCGIASRSISDDTFDCGDTGPNLVTLSITDINGNMSSCVSTVTVVDNTPPIAHCQSLTVTLLPPSAVATVNGAQINNGSIDLCGIQSYSLSQELFNCTDIGGTVVILTVTDVNGNTANCQAVVNVNGDEVLPEAYAGEDAIICASESAFVFVDQDFAPVINLGDGIWSTNGTGTFSNPEAFQPVYFPSQGDIDNGQVTLTLTVTSNVGSCSGMQAQDDLILILDNTDTDGDGLCDSQDPCPDCLSDIYLGNDPDISDPCSCLNNATNLFDGQFSEIITVAGPEGLTWMVTVADGLFEPNSPEPPVLPNPIPLGTILEETSPGIYQLSARHIDEIGFFITVENEFGDVLSIGSTCYYPNPAIIGLNDVYCVYSGPVELVGDAEGAAGSGSFTIDGLPATIFEPNILGAGTYEVAYTFDAEEASMDDPTDPGCQLTIYQTVTVEDINSIATNNNISVTLDQNCEAVIIPDMILEGEYTCIDDFIVNVYAPNGTNLGDTIPSDYSGQTLNVILTTQAGPYVAFSTITLYDYSAPMIDCPDNTDRISVEEDIQFINGALGGSDLALDLNNYSCYQNLITPGAGDHYYDVFSFTVSETDIYFFELNATFGEGIGSLYQGSFDPANGICADIIIQSNNTTSGIGYFNTVAPVSKFALQLVPGQTYLLFTSSKDVNLTGAYQWAMYSEGDGLINNVPAQNLSIVRKLYCDDLNGILNRPSSLALTGNPFVSDNCSTVDFLFSDQVQQSGQCGDYVITRTFTATDGAGLSNSCAQTITLRQPTLDDLILPPLIYITECDETFPTTDDGHPHPLASGYPFIQAGLGVYNLDPLFCGLAASFEDQPTIETCESGYKVVREWTLLNGCNPIDLRYYNQIINVDDFTPPVIVCPPNNEDDGIVYSTDPFDCTASFNAPLPEVTDNCSSWEINTKIVTDVEVPIIDQWGQVIGTTIETVVLATIADGASRYITGIQPGCHRFRYTVTDACGNANVLECDFCVEDRIEPSAICDDDLTISLGGAGYGRIFATDVDEGSSDNCALDRLEVRRLVNQNPNSCEPVPEYFTAWGAFVEFYCCDVNQIVTVQLRVVDTVGNQNICTMEIFVEDKIRPFCSAPQDIDVACNTLPYNFVATDTTQLKQLFGTSTVQDNCPMAYNQELAPIVNLDDCGFGSIVRRFRSIDHAGNISTNTCQQVVNILPIHNYEIRFPRDTQANCGDVEPDSLEINALACDQFAIGVDDQIFSASGDDCYKIFRTYRVVNWCEYDDISPARVVSRDEDCDGNPGDEDVWVIVRPNGVVYLDRDINEFNNNPVAFAKGNSCDGLSNPTGHWINSNISGNASPARNLSSVGFWIYEQHISVYDNTPPLITVGSPDPFCSEDGTNCTATATIDFSLSENCTPGDLTIQIFEEGNPNQNIANEILNGAYPDFQISGDFPIGLHQLNIVVEDGCNNTAAQMVSFEIVDCVAPTPVCIHGLSVELALQLPNTDADGDGDEDLGAATIWANNFVSSPTGDCSDPIRYSIQRADSVAIGVEIPNPNQDSLVVTCDEIGNFSIRIYAWDSANNPYALQPDGTLGGPNYDYCTTVLLVQDNQGVCIDMATISGRIATEEDNPLEGVHVALSGQSTLDMYTTEGGTYQFEELPYGGDYTITPHLDSAANNGVSTFDMIVIKQHILGTNLLDSPYKILAADATNNGTVSTADLIQIRRIILGVWTHFPTNTSWRFIPSAYEFPDPTNPWLEDFPEVISYNNLSGDDLQADFVAIKIGDVNLNASTNNLSDPDHRFGGESLFFEMQDVDLHKGQTYAIPIRVPQLKDVLGYQFTLAFDPQELTIVDVLPGIAGPEHFGKIFLEQGLLTTSWFREDALISIDDSPMFTLMIRAETSGLLRDRLTINSRITPTEAYHRKGNWMEPVLFFGNYSAKAGAFELFQNLPNPFSHKTTIGFNLPETDDVHLSIHTIEGKLLREWRGEYSAGMHYIEVDGKDLPTGVVLYYTLESGANTASKKMVKLR